MSEPNQRAESAPRQARPPQARPTHARPAGAASANFRALSYAMLLLLLAFLVESGSRAYFGQLDKATLQNAIAQQQTPLLAARKIRQQTDNLVLKTQQLATQGNSNAARILEQLRASGVTIKPKEQ